MDIPHEHPAWFTTALNKLLTLNTHNSMLWHSSGMGKTQQLLNEVYKDGYVYIVIINDRKGLKDNIIQGKAMPRLSSEDVDTILDLGTYLRESLKLTDCDIETIQNENVLYMLPDVDSNSKNINHFVFNTINGNINTYNNCNINNQELATETLANKTIIHETIKELKDRIPSLLAKGIICACIFIAAHMSKQYLDFSVKDIVNVVGNIVGADQTEIDKDGPKFTFNLKSGRSGSDNLDEALKNEFFSKIKDCQNKLSDVQTLDSLLKRVENTQAQYFIEGKEFVSEDAIKMARACLRSSITDVSERFDI